MTYSAISVAKFFLSIPDADSGELVSNLKLQKLLYYSQGYAVAMNGIENPLFADKIYAWKHGPVVKTVYNHYSGYGAGALPPESPPQSLDADTREFLNEIYRVFGRFSAWVLRDMTHRETPWKKNFRADVLDIEIPLDDLRSEFLPHVQKAEQ